MARSSNQSDTLRTTEATLDPRCPLPSESAASRLLAFYEIGSQLVEQREPQEVIRTIHRALVKHLDPDHACVLSIGKDGSYTPLTVHNLDLTNRPQYKWALSHTACKRAQAEGLAVLTSDPSHDVALKHARSIHGLMIRSIICVPLGRKVTSRSPALVVMFTMASGDKLRKNAAEQSKARPSGSPAVRIRAESWRSA